MTETASDACVQESPNTGDSETFTFCAGKPWPKSPTNPDGTHIGLYIYGSPTRDGTMADAKEYLDFVNEQAGGGYRIYRLVEVVEDGDDQPGLATVS